MLVVDVVRIFSLSMFVVSLAKSVSFMRLLLSLMLISWLDKLLIALSNRFLYSRYFLEAY